MFSELGAVEGDSEGGSGTATAGLICPDSAASPARSGSADWSLQTIPQQELVCLPQPRPALRSRLRPRRVAVVAVPAHAWLHLCRSALGSSQRHLTVGP